MIKKRLKVLFIPAWYPSKDLSNKSGIFNREHVFSAAKYDDVAVLVFTFRDDRIPFRNNIEEHNDNGIPTYRISYGKSFIPFTTRYIMIPSLRTAVNHVIARWGLPDVFHTQDMMAYPLMKATEHLGIPYVISQHWTGFSRRIINRKNVNRFRWAFSKAHRVLHVHKFIQKDYDHYGIDAILSWLPNALDAEMFKPETSKQRKPWLLHVSNMDKKKRVGDILLAWAKVCSQRPGAMLLLAGCGPDTPKYKSEAEDILPESAYKFVGSLARHELATLMRQSCGFVLPSKMETFGCVLMEAMACGCPVLTTRVGGIPAVVREGEGLFVDVDDIDAIAERMLRLLDGTHGIDTQLVSCNTRQRFSREAVGSILHEEHLSAFYSK